MNKIKIAINGTTQEFGWQDRNAEIDLDTNIEQEIQRIVEEYKWMGVTYKTIINAYAKELYSRTTEAAANAAAFAKKVAQIARYESENRDD